MPYHHSKFKKLALVLFLAGCFLWTKRELIEQWLPADSANANALVEFGPFPMMPDIPPIPDLPKEEEFLLPEHQELMEQQLEFREKLLKELKEKTDRIRID